VRYPVDLTAAPSAEQSAEGGTKEERGKRSKKREEDLRREEYSLKKVVSGSENELTADPERRSGPCLGGREGAFRRQKRER